MGMHERIQEMADDFAGDLSDTDWLKLCEEMEEWFKNAAAARREELELQPREYPPSD